MTLLNPKLDKFDHLDAYSKNLLTKTVNWFENKGKEKVKNDDHERVWYADFLDFVKKEKLFYTFLTPSQYGGENCRWDTYRNVVLNEILGFYGLCYWYTWQVTILGLGPIWMSKNEELKKKTAALLEQGEIFAFGLSEKEHGADLYSSDMLLKPQGGGRYFADGDKYYIGNANEAALVSTFGHIAKDNNVNPKEKEYVFFAVNSKHEKYECVKNVCNSQNYVAEYKLNNYPITDKDILSRGREAWDTSLNTINVGKFNLGWASIGICTHAFYEAINHASHRNLFDHYVTDFTHVRQLFNDAYLRLVSMKLFSLRAADYMRASSESDRRYLLFNPMVKMKVTTQGEEVINLLWDVIAAKGFEKDMHFEMAARDIRALPKLEGTVHVNMALIVKFMANYFFKPGKFPKIDLQNGQKNDDFLFTQGLTKGLGKIKFHDYKIAYDVFNIPNINIFKKQINTFKQFLVLAKPKKNQIKDFDFLLNLGEIFTLVAYGQLIIEKFKMDGLDTDLLDSIFDVLIRDFSKYALVLYSKNTSTVLQRFFLKKMIKKSGSRTYQANNIWEKYVFVLKDKYEMNA